MLILSRKNRQQILIADHIVITIVQVKGNSVRLGIEAPAEVKVLRGELKMAADRRQLPRPDLSRVGASGAKLRDQRGDRGAEDECEQPTELERDVEDRPDDACWSVIRRSSKSGQRPLRRFIRRSRAEMLALAESV